MKFIKFRGKRISNPVKYSCTKKKMFSIKEFFIVCAMYTIRLLQLIKLGLEFMLAYTTSFVPLLGIKYCPFPAKTKNNLY